MEENKSTEIRVREFYISLMMIDNTMKDVMSEQQDSLLKSSWSLGLTETLNSIKWMYDEMIVKEYTFDYKQATTFKTYLKIAENIIHNLKDNLTDGKEGYPIIESTRTMLLKSYLPFCAFINKRVDELGIIKDIPEEYRKLFLSFNGDYKLAEDDTMRKLYEIVFEDMEREGGGNGEGLEEIENKLEEYFGKDFTLQDLEGLKELIGNTTKETAKKIDLTLDF